MLGRKIIIIIEKLFWFPFSHLLPFWQGCDLLLSCEKCLWQVRCSRGKIGGSGSAWRALKGREGEDVGQLLTKKSELPHPRRGSGDSW